MTADTEAFKTTQDYLRTAQDALLFVTLRPPS